MVAPHLSTCDYESNEGSLAYSATKISMSISGEKALQFHFHLERGLHSYLHTSWAHQADLEIFLNFDFFASFFIIFRTLKVSLTTFGHRFELFVQVYDPTSSGKQHIIGLAPPLFSIYGFKNEKLSNIRPSWVIDGVGTIYTKISSWRNLKVPTFVQVQETSSINN